MHCESWCSLSEEELGKRDIAEVNLAAAYDLPPTRHIDVRGLCRKVDDWSEIIDRKTKHAVRMRDRMSHKDLSDSQFRITAMITILQRDLGVRYDPKCTQPPFDHSDCRTRFIHGLLMGHGGTCVSIPVLYTAVGRRVGYPIKLVLGKDHVFCRWDDPSGERFNIESTCHGFVSHSDEYYRAWPGKLTDDQIEKGRLLKSLTPRHELAFFLSVRGDCALENFSVHNDYWLGVAADCFFSADKLVPANPYYRGNCAIAMIFHRAIEAVRLQYKTSPDTVGFPMPVPKERWERDMYPIAQEMFWRIIGNRRRKYEAAQRAGSQSNSPPCQSTNVSKSM